MRCPYCDAPNDEGAAICSQCAAPLTAYAGTALADADPARTAARAARLASRPPVAVVVAVADLLAALVPVGVMLRVFRAAPSLSDDATNYLGHAFGGLRAVLTAAIMLPMAGALVLLAWGAMTQKPWAWTAQTGLLALIAVVSVVTLRANPAMSLIQLAVVAAAAWQWLHPEVRQWYGQS